MDVKKLSYANDWWQKTFISFCLSFKLKKEFTFQALMKKKSLGHGYKSEMVWSSK